MNLLDLTFPTPAENLACDEALLDWCDARGRPEILRFWMPETEFVVVGYANSVSTEAREGEAGAPRVPVLRRCTGGGTVLQGPGCLNYALILKIEEGGPLQSIPAANRFILDRNRAALEEALRSKPISTEPSPASAEPGSLRVQGQTDLAIGQRKISGNAQRRKRRFLLFHGTFLLRFDVSRVESILRFPSKQPEYRRHRPHAEFLSNIDLAPDAVKRAMQGVWRAFEPLENPPIEKIASLSRDKYETIGWNRKFP